MQPPRFLSSGPSPYGTQHLHPTTTGFRSSAFQTRTDYLRAVDETTKSLDRIERSITRGLPDLPRNQRLLGKIETARRMAENLRWKLDRHK